MEENFKLALTFTLKWEGGDQYTNDPSDPGGETKYGISKRSYPDIDIKSLTKAEAEVIYLNDYWYRSGCPMLGKPLAICVFDTSVNVGVGRCKKWLANLDINEVVARKEATKLLQYRLGYYQALVKQKPTLAKYAKGWANRVNDLSKYIDTV